MTTMTQVSHQTAPDNADMAWHQNKVLGAKLPPPTTESLAVQSPDDQRIYPHHYVRFVRTHWEEFQTAYLAPTPASCRSLLERLRREYVTLPPRHICTCFCSYLRERTTGNVCVECRKRRANAVNHDIAVEIGRSQPVNAPIPLVVCLDVEAGYAV